LKINFKEIKMKDISRDQWYSIIPLGDIHLGNIGCDIEKLKKQINYIKEKENCYWIGMGDYVDCINYTDKRFDPTTIAKPFVNNLANCVPLQIEELMKTLNPIKNKCLGLHRGNHEEKIRLKYHHDLIYEMRKLWDFNVPDLEDSAITRLRFVYDKEDYTNMYSFDIFSTHGNVGGRKGGAKVNRLEDLIGYVDANVYLMAHSHIKLTFSRGVIYVDKNLNMKYKKRILAVTGCYMNGYIENGSNYVEKWNYPPTSTGSVKIMFNPRRHDIHVSE
jgi:hypothetical protein